MNKQIKDYLHYYIGQELTAVYLDEKRKGYLTGIHGEYGAEIQFFEDDGVNVMEEPNYCDYPEVVLHLRKFSSMTMDELIGIEPIVSPGKVFTDNERKGALDYIKAKDIDALIFDDNDPRLVFQVFDYFIKLGFDLFGLIEAGLAVDKSTL